MGIINEIICTKMKPFIHSHRVLPIARMCNKGFKSLGGHAIFDNKIVIN